MARKSSAAMRPLPVPPPRQGTELLDRRPGVVAHLFAWLLGSLFVSLYLGGWGFGTAFCGFDWDAPCKQRYVAGWAVIAVTIAAILGLAFLTRRRSIVVTAMVSVPVQVWYYATEAIPMASSVPNLPG
ncbi:MAG: hypothetical protein OXI97_10780 [Acidimicrobiaceae bacterium]|nr:hypothetical protein [Acidimicrobiaceae bacterium]